MSRKPAFLLLVFTGTALHAQTTAPPSVVILVGRDLPAYHQVLEAFEKNIRKQWDQPLEIESIPLSRGSSNTTPLWSGSPRLVLAIGTESAELLWGRSDVDIPVLTALTDFGGSRTTAARASKGPWIRCALYAAPEETWRLIRQSLPDVKTVGVLYSMEAVGARERVEELEKAAASFGVHLQGQRIASPSEIPHVLEQMFPQVQAILGLLDPVVYSPPSAEFILRECLNRKVPFVGPSPSFAHAGAVLAIYSNPADMGKQAAEVASGVLRSGRFPSSWVAARTRWAVNLHVARFLGIQFPLGIRARAEEIYGGEN